MNSDFRDLLRLLNEHEVRYLVIGGYAVIHYTEPRFTRDLDIWLWPTKPNARQAARALKAFGVPLIEVTEADLVVASTPLMIGLPPMRSICSPLAPS